MIHFTPNGVFADTEEERLDFYDRLCAGDPVVYAHIEIWRLSLKEYQQMVEYAENVDNGNVQKWAMETQEHHGKM